MSRRSERREARQERKATRQNARTERTALRQESKKAAYEAGIDPNAWVGDAFEAAGNVGAAYFGAKGGGAQSGLNKSAGAGGGEGLPEPTAGTGQTKMNPIIIVAVLAVVAIFMFKKK